MTVSTTTSRIEYLGDGATMAFAFPYYFLATSDLVVYVNATLQTMATHYSVSGAGAQAGGTVTFVTAPGVSDTVVIFRAPALTQSTDYTANDEFPAESHETAIDRLTMITQRLSSQVSRAVKAPDSTTGTLDFTLPAALTPDTFLMINGDGNGLALGALEDYTQAVQFTQAGTGAVVRLTQDKARETVSPLDFGAVGDGVTDDTAALQLALDYIETVPEAWRCVDLCGRAYVVSSPLILNQSQTRICDGKLIADAVNFAADGSGSEAILRLNTGLRIRVENVYFECNFVADGIHCENQGFGNYYFGLEVNEFKTFGIKLEGSGDQRVSHTLITQYGNDGALRTGTCLWIATGDIKVHNSTFRYADRCLFLESVNTNLIQNCHFYNGNPGGMTNPLTNSVNIEVFGGTGNTISGCYIDKGRVVLIGNGAMKTQFVGNRYLFTTSTPEHDSIFLFDAYDVAAKTFPAEWIHVGHYITLPVENGTIPFIELTASNGGSWDASADAIVADLQAAGRMPQQNFGERYRLQLPDASDIHIFEAADTGVIGYALAGATYPVYVGMLASSERLTKSNGLRDRYASIGTLTTGTHSIEGSRASAAVAARYRLSDRRNSSTMGLSETDLGYFSIELISAASTNPCDLRLVRSDPGSATETNEAYWTSAEYRPGVDNARTLGNASYRWSEVFAANGTINTSDEREKQDIAAVSNAILDAWASVQWSTFRYKDAVAAKGEAARTHVGLVAQQIKAAFESHNLDPFALGVLCYDEWDAEVDEEGNEIRAAGNRYGVRYDQAMALEAALVRRALQSGGLL